MLKIYNSHIYIYIYIYIIFTVNFYSTNNKYWNTHNSNPGGNKSLKSLKLLRSLSMTHFKSLSIDSFYYELYWNGSIDKDFIDLFSLGNINV